MQNYGTPAEVVRTAPDGTRFSNLTRNIPTMAESAAGIVPAGYATAEKFAAVPAGSLVRPNGYRTTAPAPAPAAAEWSVVAMDSRGGWEIVGTGTLDGCTGQATARANHPANYGTGRTFAVILSEGAAAVVEKLKS